MAKRTEPEAPTPPRMRSHRNHSTFTIHRIWHRSHWTAAMALAQGPYGDGDEDGEAVAVRGEDFQVRIPATLPHLQFSFPLSE